MSRVNDGKIASTQRQSYSIFVSFMVFKVFVIAVMDGMKLTHHLSPTASTLASTICSCKNRLLSNGIEKCRLVFRPAQTWSMQ